MCNKNKLIGDNEIFSKTEYKNVLIVENNNVFIIEIHLKNYNQRIPRSILLNQRLFLLVKQQYNHLNNEECVYNGVFDYYFELPNYINQNLVTIRRYMDFFVYKFSSTI